MRVSVVTAALVAALVGIAGALAIVLAAAEAVSASPAQTTSWVTALCLSMALTSGYLSWRHRVPVITAWSTPGAAVIAATAGSIRIEAAVGAFLLAGALIVATALIGPLDRAIRRIPVSVAAGMLAGVLVRFVLQMVEAIPEAPALVGLGIPLFLVTMASQNLPGAAVIRASGYEPPFASALLTTGLASILIAPLGAHTINLAAITAAICTGPDAHPDPAERWRTGVAYLFVYVGLALLGAALVGLFAVFPAPLVKAIAGLGLIGSLTGALGSALADEKQRFAAVLAFAVTASGVALLGIGSAFWGLLAGLAVLGLDRLAAGRRSAK